MYLHDRPHDKVLGFFQVYNNYGNATAAGTEIPGVTFRNGYRYLSLLWFTYIANSKLLNSIIKDNHIQLPDDISAAYYPHKYRVSLAPK